MKQASIDELLRRCGSVYKLVVIAAKRAKELAEGGQKFVDTDLKKATSIALEEIRQGKVLCSAQEDEETKGERKKERGKSKEKAAVSAGARKKA